MGNKYFAGDPGIDIRLGPYDLGGVVDGNAIDSAVVRVRRRGAAADAWVDWEAVPVEKTTKTATASTVTNGTLNALADLYIMRAHFYVEGVLVFQAPVERSVLFEPPLSGPTPELPPPYSAFAADIAEAQAQAADAVAAASAAQADADAATAAVTALDTRVDALVPVLTAVRAVLTTGGALSGSTADGVTLQAGDRVLNAPTSAATAAGIYSVPVGLGAWVRAADMPAAATIGLGAIVSVLDGSASNVGLWGLASPTTGAPVVGTAALLFQRIAALEPAPAAPFDPSQATGAYGWALGITDPAYRTMTGSRVDTLINGVPNGGTLVRSAGNPVIDTATVLNGYNPLRMDATTEIACASGGPSANQAHWIMVLTDGSHNAFSGMARAGALSAAGGVGVTTSQRYAAGLVAAEGVPRVDAPEPTVNGAMRVVGLQHLPMYGQLTVMIDGYAPQAASGSAWTFAKTVSLNGTWALGKIETGGVVNTSAIYDVVWGTGVLGAADRAAILNYWVEKFSLARLAPRILIIGDSNSTTTPSSPATTSWVTLLTNALTTQLAIDARTMPTISNIALSGKAVGGDWSIGGTASPSMQYQADGNYVAFVAANTNNQGQGMSAPFSRSGRREYEIAIVMGGTNDLINQNITGAQLIERVQYICSQLKAHGYYVVLQTCIPGSSNSGYYGDGTPGTREVHRDTFNAWVVADAIDDGYADRVVDHDGNGLTWPADFDSDTVHYADAGGVKMAAAVYAQVYDLIQEIDP